MMSRETESRGRAAGARAIYGLWGAGMGAGRLGAAGPGGGAYKKYFAA